MSHGADQADAAFDFTVFQGEAWRGDADGGAFGFGVDKEGVTGLRTTSDRVGELDGVCLGAFADGVGERLGARRRVGVDRSRGFDFETVGDESFQAAIV